MVDKILLDDGACCYVLFIAWVLVLRCLVAGIKQFV